jgi:hypothetical protein
MLIIFYLSLAYLAHTLFFAVRTMALRALTFFRLCPFDTHLVWITNGNYRFGAISIGPPSEPQHKTLNHPHPNKLVQNMKHLTK